MVKRIYYYLIISFTLFIIVFSIGNFIFYKKINSLISSITQTYQYNFIIKHKIYDKINLIEKVTQNYYNYLLSIQTKSQIDYAQNSIQKIISILKTLEKLNFKNYKPFLFEYISDQYNNDIDIIQNGKIIISKDFQKIGKSYSPPCDPLANLGYCSANINGEFYYLAYSPYYKIILQTKIKLKTDKRKIKKKVIEILQTIPNIILYADQQKIKGEFDKDKFYVFNEFKPLHIFFGFGINYKRVDELSNKLQKEIFNSLKPTVTTFIVLYVLALILFYFITFWYFNSKIHLLHKEFSEYEITALYDKLTGVLNRNGFEKAISEKECKVFLITDLDNFKYINDTFGHEKGDFILKQFASALKQYFKNDIVGRWGGDEFLVCTDKSKEEIKTIFELINTRMQAIQKTFDKKMEKKISVSAGGCSCMCDNFQKRFSNADMALYKVKKTGKGRVMFFEEINYIKFEKEDLKSALPRG